MYREPFVIMGMCTMMNTLFCVLCFVETEKCESNECIERIRIEYQYQDESNQFQG